MERVPVGDVFLFCDKVKMSRAHHNALRVVTFIIRAAQAPLVCYFVDVEMSPLSHLIGDIPYV